MPIALALLSLQWGAVGALQFKQEVAGSNPKCGNCFFPPLSKVLNMSKCNGGKELDLIPFQFTQLIIATHCI